MAETTNSAAQTEQSIAVIVEHEPQIVLLNAAKRDELFAYIEKEVEEFVPDLTSAKGRDAIKSFAAKITRTKTTLDATAMQLTEEWRLKTAAVNKARAPILEKLAALAKQARAPLTEWEDAEDKRQAECKAALDRMREAAVVPMGITSDGIRARITEIEAESMAEDHWQGMRELAQKAKETALEALNAALERIVKAEEEAAELARLRAEAAERVRLDAERREREDWEKSEQERIAREEQAAKELAEAREREAEETREREEQAAARAAEEREVAAETAAKAAALAAQREAEARAAEQAAEQARAHAQALAAERERARIAEEAAEAEREKERQRLAAEQAAAAERARLEADQARRTAAKREAKEAIMTVDGVTEKMARDIVVLILAQEVPRVFLDFAAEPKVKKAAPVPEGQLV